MKVVEKLLVDLAGEWKDASRPTLRVIGSTALMLLVDYDRGTKDTDVLESMHLDDATKRRLLALAGADTPLATKWRMYLQLVPNGVPFLPHKPTWHDVTISGASEVFDIKALDVVDVVVSKLKRLNPNDRTDVSEMIKKGLVPHQQLVDRFRDAVEEWASGAQADKLPKYIENLNEVERDMLLVDETEIEIPDWADC